MPTARSDFHSQLQRAEVSRQAGIRRLCFLSFLALEGQHHLRCKSLQGVHLVLLHDDPKVVREP